MVLAGLAKNWLAWSRGRSSGTGGVGEVTRHRPAKRNPVRAAVLRYLASGFVAVVLISLLGVWLFRSAGEAEAIRDAKDQTRLAAEGSIEPILSDALVRGDPSALAALDRVAQERVLSDPSVVRVKLWDRSGRVIYSDEPRLIGTRYPLSRDDLGEFASRRVDAAVTNLSKRENRYERGFGRLLEVYMPIRTPSGQPLRYEAYYRSSFISARGQRIFRQFAPVMLSALILLALIQLPLAWQLATRVRRTQDERERLLKHAIDASELERHRIARDLHDGVVQDLAAVSYSLSAAAESAPAPFDAQLRDAAAETRQGIRQLRTLLVEIYPPELHRAGLSAALADLLTASEARGIETFLDIDPELALGRKAEELFFRVAQEALRNVIKHAGATRVGVTVGRKNGRLQLLVEDNGSGFSPESSPGNGHFGLRILAELVRDSDGELEIDSAPGTGSRVSVEVPA
jgi:two-component system NarL family sensor kinase